jgi:hypothetical protein
VVLRSVLFEERVIMLTRKSSVVKSKTGMRTKPASEEGKRGRGVGITVISVDSEEK